jgi:hypothetical protein
MQTVNTLHKYVLYLSYVRHEYVCKSDSITARIVDLDTRWKWTVSFTPQPALFPSFLSKPKVHLGVHNSAHGVTSACNAVLCC